MIEATKEANNLYIGGKMIDLNKRLVEVETILGTLDNTYKNKIPKEIWKYIKQHKDNDYIFY